DAKTDQRTNDSSKAGTFACLDIIIAVVVCRIALHLAAGVVRHEANIVAVEAGINQILYRELRSLKVVIECNDRSSHVDSPVTRTVACLDVITYEIVNDAPIKLHE